MHPAILGAWEALPLVRGASWAFTGAAEFLKYPVSAAARQGQHLQGWAWIRLLSLQGVDEAFPGSGCAEGVPFVG